MPEYLCECCNFKTPIKCKFQAHNETSKHLNNMKSFVEPKKEANPLQVKVDMLEELVKSLIKRIEVLENKPQDANRVVEVVNEVIEPVAEPVEEEPFDLDIVIGDLVQQNEISVEAYGYYDEIQDRESIDMIKYVNDKLSIKEQIEIAEGMLDEMLLETYEEDSIKAIYHKLCKVIPDGSIKVNDLSRSKYSIYCQGQWLNPVRSTEKLEELVELYQAKIKKLHEIYVICTDLHKVELKPEKFETMLINSCQGKEVKGKVVKLILSYYNK